MTSPPNTEKGQAAARPGVVKRPRFYYDVTGRVTLVILTFNRRDEVLQTLDRLMRLEATFPICVVDNASADGTADAIAVRFPDVNVVRLPANMGAAGRNYGVQAASTDYIAFCDDDTWWAPGSLTRAVQLLDRFPGLAAVTARILVGPEEREDPTSTVMAASPLPAEREFPGTEIIGFMAGACVMRRNAFIAAGGYEPRFFLGGEESLLSFDLQAAGWRLGYVPDLVLHHHPSRLRDAAGRRRLLLRNALWCTWLRRPLLPMLRETLRLFATVLREPRLIHGAIDALRGLPWVAAGRRPLPEEVEDRLRLVSRQRR